MSDAERSIVLALHATIDTGTTPEGNAQFDVLVATLVEALTEGRRLIVAPCRYAGHATTMLAAVNPDGRGLSCLAVLIGPGSPVVLGAGPEPSTGVYL